MINLAAVRDRERRGQIAKKLIEGQYNTYQVEASYYDIDNLECCLCLGILPSVGWMYLFKNQDGDTKHLHWGCFKQAREYAGLAPEAA